LFATTRSSIWSAFDITDREVVGPATDEVRNRVGERATTQSGSELDAARKVGQRQEVIVTVVVEVDELNRTRRHRDVDRVGPGRAAPANRQPGIECINLVGNSVAVDLADGDQRIGLQYAWSGHPIVARHAIEEGVLPVGRRHRQVERAVQVEVG
jgi:hypothetical protein